MMKQWWFVLVVMFLTWPAHAANHYVRAAASGDGSGSDWANACADFSGSCAVSGLVRGDTYYVGTGTYPSRLFNTAVSGTSVITVKGATAADHGAGTGWSAAYGVDVSQAQFTLGSAVADYGTLIETSYFVFDGNTGSGSDIAAYGFRQMPPASCPNDTQGGLFIAVLSSATTTTDVTVKHVAVSGCDPLTYTVIANAFQVCGNPSYCTNITLANNYVENSVKFVQASSMANSLIERNYIRNVGSNTGAHAELISINNCHSSDGGVCTGHTTQCVQGECASNNVVRYNWFGGISGASITGGIVALQGHVYGLKDWQIYGNVFLACNGGNGCITVGDGGVVLEHTLIYNNTFVSDSSTGNDLIENSQFSADCLLSIAPPIFKNNLIYGSAAGFRECPGGPSIVHDYNSYLNVTTTPATETHIQTGSTDPFVSYSASCCGGNYHLTDGTTVDPGVDLGITYAVDLDGVTRSTWSRGAYQFTTATTRYVRLRWR